MARNLSQRVNTYLEKLETASNAGGPLGEHSAAKLDKLNSMTKNARFKWICANEFGVKVANKRDKREDAAVAMAEAVGHNVAAVDDNAAMQVLELLAAQLGVTLISPEIKVVAEKPAKPRKTTRKATRTVSKAKSDGTNRWRKTTLAKLGYKSGNGQQFKHKGQRWIIVSTDRTFAYAVKA